MKLTLAAVRKRVSDEHDAYLLLEELRWGADHARLSCPHCGNNKAYFLNPKGGARGTGKPKADGKRTQSIRRVYKCAKCRKQFSVLTGTIFHGTKVALADWLTVMVLMSSAKNGISAREVERLIGVTPETAWFMLHRLREAMKREPLAGLLSGVVVSDETWIGGDPKNRHGHKPGGTKGQTSKTPVVALVDTRTGEVRSTVVPRVNGDNLRRVIERNVDMDATVLHTDSALAYKHIGPTMAGHEKVDHYSGEYVNRNGATTNHAEGYFSQLKRSIDGTHHHVSVEHLPRYLAQFDFLYSTRRLDDSVRLQRMVDQAEGRRLTYRPLLQGE